MGEQIQKQKRRRAHKEENIDPPLPKDERDVLLGEQVVRIVEQIEEQIGD